MIDEHGQLIYIGKAKSLRKRLLSYFHLQADDAKAGDIIRHTDRLVWERTPHELVALARELELIRRFLPRFNVQGRPDRFGRHYVCLGRGPAPYAFVADEPPRQADACFGPLRSKARISEAVRFVNHQFRLRDCPQRVQMIFSDQLRLFDGGRAAQCPRLDMETCLGPCAGACSQSQYADRAKAAERFLAGRDGELLDRLQSGMREAAESRQFERAAMLRDIWASLDWLDGSLTRLRVARQKYSFVYPVTTADGRAYWLAISRGQMQCGALAPRCAHSSRFWRQRLKRVFRGPFRPQVAAPEDVDMLLLVTAWFRRFPAELAHVIRPRAAMRLCCT
jgi:excinuclease ABC subunit C